MPMVMDRITEEALTLPADARLKLVDALLASLNLPSAADVDHAWAEEAERRIAQIDAGEAKLLDGNEVFASLRAKYAR